MGSHAEVETTVDTGPRLGTRPVLLGKEGAREAGLIQRLTHIMEDLTGSACNTHRSWDKVFPLAVKSSEALGTRF